jgi:hypothetical protein
MARRRVDDGTKHWRRIARARWLLVRCIGAAAGVRCEASLVDATGAAYVVGSLQEGAQ